MKDPNEEYRSPLKVKALIREINKYNEIPVSLMEVCGSHTMAIFRYGLKSMLPPNIRLLSGPGCPVCVTPGGIIDAAIEIAGRQDTILATFGDMIRVPGSKSSLAEAKARGIDLRVVYSPLDAVELAAKNPGKEVVFLAIGFETTASTVAAIVLTAEELGLENFSLISSNKTIPKALRVLLQKEDVRIDGLICPGHVSTIIGSEPYEFIPRELGIPAVITGFEPVDILQGILMLLEQVAGGITGVAIQYKRGVAPEGNRQAQGLLRQVFQPADAFWRGLGLVPGSGLELRERFQNYDALVKWRIPVIQGSDPPGCRCGEVLRGAVTPPECPLFGKDCTPVRPVGACMVSGEGTCAAYYKYGT